MISLLRQKLLMLFFGVVWTASSARAFSALPPPPPRTMSSSSWGTTRLSAAASSTVEAPTREKTNTDESSTKRKDQSNSSSSSSSSSSNDDTRSNTNNNNNNNNDLEYYQDASQSREPDDPFHILLMGSTFEKPNSGNTKQIVTVEYVSGSLQYVLGMPRNEATELAAFAHAHGMSCLGTWPRETCLSLGTQLRVRDIVCRVVPYAPGGQRAWQAKEASSSLGASAGASIE